MKNLILIATLTLTGCSSLQSVADSPTAKAAIQIVEELQDNPQYAQLMLDVYSEMAEKDYVGAAILVKAAAQANSYRDDCKELFALLDLIERLAL